MVNCVSGPRLIIVFAIAFSLAALPGPISSHFSLLSLPSVRAASAPNQQWYPAGPAMDVLQTSIFQDEASEFNAISQPNPSIDLTDSPLTSSLLASFTANPNLLVTSQVTAHDYFEIEFNLDNIFWGINFNFGNDQNGVHLRQGISHLINKGLFTSQQGDIKGLSVRSIILCLQVPISPRAVRTSFTLHRILVAGTLTLPSQGRAVLTVLLVVLRTTVVTARHVPLGL
jgi:hypothetical protein